MKNAIAAATALALTMSSTVGHAFCGFYVSGSDKKMFNAATNVVLMRSGTKTVLGMQNDYRGPLEDFAMVVPVPVVLKQTDVRIVDKAVFDRLDSLGSPRLVEYWEEDPCPPPPPDYSRMERQRGIARPSVAMKAPEPMMDAPKSMDRGDDDMDRRRKPVAPILASFSVQPPTVTSDVATDMTWSFQYANSPWPEPTCTIDHGVGRVQDGLMKPLTLAATTKVTLTCANSAGRSTKDVTINAVKIEAQFDVAEYQIVILSATEAAGLDSWLKLNHYKIPEGAEPLLRPYIENGSKFFVAKVNPAKVQMVDGHAALSPLRFQYDSDEFALPIRLGMANSPGKQDLIVNILSPDKRYEVANYKNVFIPTNFDVKPGVKTRFAEFYAALFDKTIEKNPGSVVTEYAWTAVPNYHCDPCTSADVSNPDLNALGADVMGGPLAAGTFVYTRLHARYGKEDMKDDLRFREAAPVTGGREQWTEKGLEYGATPSGQNYFQARYAIRYWWTGPIKCKNPHRGVWGGPPDGRNTQVVAASKTAFAPRGKLQLATVIKRDLWEINLKKAVPPPPKASPPPTTKSMWFGGGALFGLALVGLGALRRRRESR